MKTPQSGETITVRIKGASVKGVVNAVRDGKVYMTCLKTGKRFCYPLKNDKETPETSTEPKPLPASIGLLDKLRQNREQERLGAADPNAPHIQVKALAGTGKTFTLAVGTAYAFGQKWPSVWSACKEALGFEPRPSEQQQQVWDSLALSRDAKHVRFGAFNKSVVQAFERQYQWLIESLKANGVWLEFTTMHSLGYESLRSKLGPLKPEENLVGNLVAVSLGYESRSQALFRNPYQKENPNKAREDNQLVRHTESLAGYCKLNLLITDAADEGEDDWVNQQMLDLIDHYEIDIDPSQVGKVLALTKDVLVQCRNPLANERLIDFDDMVSLPSFLNLDLVKADVFLGDETQDWNPAQRALAIKSGHRLVLVGDEHQAIYGFAGADSKSMRNCHEEMVRSKRGCVQLPLTVTRRCGKAIVQEAKRYVPAFEPHEDSPEGRVIYNQYFVQEQQGVRHNVLEEHTFLPAIEPGDMVICPRNGPLIATAMRLLRRGVLCQVLGRDIGASLIAVIQRVLNGMTDMPVPTFIAALQQWAQNEREKMNAQKNPSESKLQAIDDKFQCINWLVQDAQFVSEAAERIKFLFTNDNREYNHRVLLSSIHKAKGLEARRVFLVVCCDARTKASSKEWQAEQQRNLMYVGVTRAIETLVYVT